MTDKGHFEKALQYVRDNADWSKACEEHALEIMDECRCPIDHASEEIAWKIADLMDEYGEANDLSEDWWRSFTNVDEIFFKL